MRTGPMRAYTEREYVERFARYDRNEDPVEADYVYAISDLHTDVGENMKWIDALPDCTGHRAALIVAGDVATSLETIRATLSRLSKLFVAVWYTVGNHELWLDGGCGSENSVEKFFRILDLCRRLGVRTGPGRVAKGVTILPLYSWWKLDFSEDVPMHPALARMDWRCKWPSTIGTASNHPGVCTFFLKLNERRLAQDYGDDVLISFSHFLPKIELFYGKPSIGRVMGCRELGAQLDSLDNAQGRVHVFGHSHLNIDTVIAKVRYVQFSLGMPRERRSFGSMLGIFGAAPHGRIIWRSPSNRSTLCTITDVVRQAYTTLRAHVVAYAFAWFVTRR
eukprot:1190561-Prorocentrum_minimum.AAC.2